MIDCCGFYSFYELEHLLDHYMLKTEWMINDEIRIQLAEQIANVETLAESSHIAYA